MSCELEEVGEEEKIIKKAKLAIRVYLAVVYGDKINFFVSLTSLFAYVSLPGVAMDVVFCISSIRDDVENSLIAVARLCWTEWDASLEPPAVL
jgi:hypothetical protein